MKEMVLIILFSSMGALAGDLPYLDSDFDCISDATARKYVNDFNINVKSFGGFELCDERVDTKKLFNDLHLVNEGKFAGHVKNMFMGDFVDRDKYYSWLKQMTYGINRRQDSLTATAYNRGGYFTMQDAWAALSTLGRVGVVVHEARHTEGYSHVPCRYGPYQGMFLPGCDKTFASGGSHSVEMEYYARVVFQGQNFHPVYSSMARMMNLARSNFVFNEGPMAMREALLTLTGDEVQLFDGNNEMTFSVEDATGSLLKRTSAGAVLFDGKTAWVIDMYAPINVLYRDNYSYYKIHNLNLRVTNFKDFEEFDVGSKRYVVGLTDGDELYSFNFQKGGWFTPIRIKGAQFLSTVSPEGKRGLFVVKMDHSVCAYNPARRRCDDIMTQWPDHVLSYAFYGNRLIELREDGVMYDVGNGVPFKKSSVHQFVNIPLYDAYDIL